MPAAPRATTPRSTPFQQTHRPLLQTQRRFLRLRWLRQHPRRPRYNKDGKYLGQWGKKGTGDGEFDLVHDVALDKQGRVYVADRANSRVQVFDAEGKFLAKWTEIGQPWGLAYSEKENAMYIADGLNNRVVKANLDGQVLGVLGQFGKAPGSFDFAHHMAVDSEGLLIAEIKNWRVQKFAK